MLCPSRPALYNRPMATSKLRIAAVRPYPARIRSRVFETLERIGATVESAVEPGVSDDSAMRTLAGVRADVLLIPFHAHRDANGDVVHGLTLIERLRTGDDLHSRTPILCPISNVGLAAAGLMTSRVEEDLLDRVLFIYEDELDEAGVGDVVETFLHEHDVV